MRNYDEIGLFIGSLLVGLLFGLLLLPVLNSANVEQTEIRIAEAYDKGYKDGNQNSPDNEAYIEQMVDDFELTIELQQYYYQENITSHSFGDWLQINYPELYKRIESYL